MSRTRPLSLTKVSVATTALLVVVAVAVFAASAYSLVGLTRARHRESDVLDAAVAANSDLLELYLNEETGLRGYLTTADASFLQPFQSSEPRIPGVETTLARLVTSIPKAPAELQQVVAGHQRWVNDYANPAIAEVEGGHMAEAQSVGNVSAGRSLFDSIRNSMGALFATIAAAQHAVEQTVGTRRNQLWAVLAVSLLALLLAAVATAVVNRRLVTAPLAALGRQVAEVAGGDLEHQLASDGPAEIRELAGAVEVMRARLAASIDDARRSAEALTQEGPAVTALRRALAPLPTSLPGVDVAGRLQPATGLLAGDWWDTFALPRGRSAVVVGDVSGHGAAAGVFAFQLKHLIALAVRAGNEPGAALAAALAETQSTSDELFATAFVAVLDPARGEVVYANAGHPDGIIMRPRGDLPGTGTGRLPEPETGVGGDAGHSIRSSGASLSQTTSAEPGEPPRLVNVPPGGQPSSPMAPYPHPYPHPHPGPSPSPTPDRTAHPVRLTQTGPLLSSIVDGHTWESRIETMAPGDLLVAVTDGITEARNDDGEEFGIARLTDAVATPLDRHPMAIAGDILDQVNHFARRGHAADDRTIIVAQLGDATRTYPARTGEAETGETAEAAG